MGFSSTGPRYQATPGVVPTSARPVRLAMPLLAVAVAAMALPGGAETDSPAVEFTGIDAFWAVAEELVNGRTPTEGHWLALFQTPGYRVLAERERADAYLRRFLPTALAPAKVEERAVALAAPGFESIAVAHLRTTWEHRGELEALRQRLAREDLLTEAVQEAIVWLPERAAELPPPRISFVLYQPEARGYGRIIMDLELSLRLPDLFRSVLAHEAHHVYREAFVRFDWDGALPEADLLRAVRNLEAEGIADLVDKPALLRAEILGDHPTGNAWRPMQDRFRAEVAAGAERLRQVDAILTSYADDPSRGPELGERLNELLVLGGHPIGYYMATTIRDARGAEAVVELVGDPFGFLRAYDAVATARGGGLTAFSAGARRGLEMLEAVAVGAER